MAFLFGGVEVIKGRWGCGFEDHLSVIGDGMY